MKTKIKLLISVFVVCLSLILVACGQTAKPDQKQPDKQEQNKLDNNKNKDPKKYTVNFYDGNTLLNSKTVNENNTVSPITPSEKEGYEFMGWYTDSSMTTKFQNDTKITSDTNLYASYMDLKEMFAKARAATIDSGKFKYDYKLDFSILKKIPGFNLHPSAYYRGTVYYNKDNSISYYKDEKVGGGLKLDRHHYDVLTAGENDLQKFNYKYKGSLQPIGKEEKPGKDGDFIEKNLENFSGKEYEYSLFAKSLFKSDDDKIETVTKIGANKYKVTFKKSIKDKALDFLEKSGMKAIKKQLEKVGVDTNIFKNVTAYITTNSSKTKIKDLYYAFDLSLNFKNEATTEEESNGGEKTKGIKLKGKIDFSVKYIMTFDNSFNGTFNIPEKIKSQLG